MQHKPNAVRSIELEAQVLLTILKQGSSLDFFKCICIAKCQDMLISDKTSSVYTSSV